MTTIAADLNSGTMAADSQVTLEHKGITYPAAKIIKRKGMLIGAAGHGGDCTRFLKWAAKNFEEKEPKWDDEESDDCVIGIVLKEDGIYVWSQGDPEPEKVEAPFYAVGSGGKPARVAMLLGKTPEEAVALACQVDPYSALPLQVLKLNNG